MQAPHDFRPYPEMDPPEAYIRHPHPAPLQGPPQPFQQGAQAQAPEPQHRARFNEAFNSYRNPYQYPSDLSEEAHRGPFWNSPGLSYRSSTREAPRPPPKQITQAELRQKEEQVKPKFQNDEFLRLEIGLPEQTQIAHKEQIIKNQDNSLNQQELLINLVEQTTQAAGPQTQDGQPADLSNIMLLLKENLKQQREIIEKSTKELEQSKQAATHYIPSLDMPPLYEYTDYSIEGTREDLQARNIRAAIQPFDKEANPDSDFAHTWRAILLYTHKFRLDESAYKHILTTLLQGSAARVLYEMTRDNKPFTAIVTALGELYAVRRTIIDEMNDLNNFKRFPKESIHTAMQRARVMTERLRHMWPPSTWESTKRLEFLVAILRQIITKPTRQHLENEELKYLKAGAQLEYNAKLDLIETFETSNNQVPSTPTGLTLAVCTSSLTTNEINDHNITKKNTQRNRKIKTMALETMDPTKRVNEQPSYQNQTQIEKKRKLDSDTGAFLPGPTQQPERIFRRARRHSPGQQGDQQRNQSQRPSQQSQPRSQSQPPRSHPPKQISGPSEAAIRPPTTEQISTRSRPDNRNYNNNNQYVDEYQKRNPNYRPPSRRGNYKRSYSNDRNYQRNRSNSPSRYDDNYRRGGGYRRGNYRGNYRRNYNRNETPEERIERLKTHFCPDCKKVHKITSFCPNTGAPTAMSSGNQRALNYEGSPGTLHGGTERS